MLGSITSRCSGNESALNSRNHSRSFVRGSKIGLVKTAEIDPRDMQAGYKSSVDRSELRILFFFASLQSEPNDTVNISPVHFGGCVEIKRI